VKAVILIKSQSICGQAMTKKSLYGNPIKKEKVSFTVNLHLDEEIMEKIRVIAANNNRTLGNQVCWEIIRAVKRDEATITRK
jgi:hypothetical protein